MVLGKLASDAASSAIDGRYMPAIACLAILAEQAVKFSNDKTEGNFYEQIEALKRSSILSEVEAKNLGDLKEIRNKMFHESHYVWVVEDENGDAAFFSEECAKICLWNKMAIPVLATCARLSGN